MSLFISLFFSQGFLASTVGGAVRLVAVINQDLSLSHVMRRGGASVWRVWLVINVTAVVAVIMVYTPTTAQVFKLSAPLLDHLCLGSDWM